MERKFIMQIIHNIHYNLVNTFQCSSLDWSIERPVEKLMA